MTSRDFCYWLQGYFELAGTEALTRGQAEMIQKHLAMVFKHEIDPSYKDSAELTAIHSPPPGKVIHVNYGLPMGSDGYPFDRDQVMRC